MSDQPRQLALDLCLKDEASFANFLIADNEQLVSCLRNSTDHFIYIWGPPGSGKTHLLAAVLQDFKQQCLTAAYLPLLEQQLQAEIFDGLAALDLVCIDDLDAIASKPEWELALFNYFNQFVMQPKRLLICANVAPSALPIALPDLKSRLTQGLTFQLQPLQDSQKKQALQLRARLRGLELSDQAAEYLLSHYQRDTKNLFMALDRLDRESLVAQRRLTIPFIKSILLI